VDTVIPYYHLFLNRFPTLESLAGAPFDRVLKTWENMGYYARARNLHRAAGIVMEEMGGEIPQSYDALLKLPGVGDYTASAILSIAFGQCFPTVDGNVKRVICRLFSIRDPLNLGATMRCIRKLASDLVPKKRPGLYNQGIMELGAVLCTPRKPSCRACPVSDLCSAHKEGFEERLPVTVKRPPLPHRQMTAAVISDKKGRLLMVRREAEGLLGGLWKFPGGEAVAGEDLKHALKRTVQEELGVEIRVTESLCSVRHAYTHFRITLHAFRCLLMSDRPKVESSKPWRWIAPGDLTLVPFSRADRKIIEAISDQHSASGF
jgi:A/G-specific adenine glycosylase